MARSLPEYDTLDATAMAALALRGEVSPGELLEAAIERVEERDPALNAVVTRLFERARGRAGALPRGPLYGVPFLLKDLKAQLKGTPTSNSTRRMKGAVAQEDSLIAARFEAAGVQTIGKSNTPEFGILGVTEPAVWGPCRNPWDLSRTPGGSSGGAAAAVAARVVPVAHAGDGGGSIRIPASACGLFGLKPTRGRVSMAPFAGEAWGGFVQEGVVSRSVRDAALCLDQIDALTPGEPYAAPHKPQPWTAHLRPPARRLRVALHRGALYGDHTHPECLRAVDEAAALLRDLGHEVEEACPPFERDALVQAYFYTVACGTARFVEDTAAYAGVRPRPSDFEPTTWLLAQIGWKCDGATLLKAQRDMHRAARGVAAFFERYDVFVSPVHAEPPLPIGAFALDFARRAQLAVVRALNSRALLDRVLETLGRDALSRTPNTQLFNQTGQPAMSVPLYWTPEGLPLGVQVAAPFGGEGLLFELAAELEEARPWAGRLPPLLSAAPLTPSPSRSHHA